MSWTVTGTEKTPVDRFGIANVSLLLHGDGTNGSTTIIDSSPSPKTVTAVGNAQISTAQSKFGGSSIAFDGTGDYLSVPASAGFDFGSGDYTIEMWVNISSAANFGGLVGKGPVGTVNTNTYSLEFNDTSNELSFYVGSGNNTGSYIITGTTNVRTAATWQHVAVCRSGNNTRLFVNGTQEGSTYTLSYNIVAGQALSIGGGFFAPSTNTINGYIDDLRITKGVARYTANFTPPTAAFPDI
jgi:hypothetical protein